MKKFLSDNTFIILFALLIGFGFLRGCTNFFDGVPQEKETLVKNIILSKYPNFESSVQKDIKSKNPTYIGSYGYKFQKTEKENVLIVKYGVQGVNWLEVFNTFNNKSTTNISISVRVDTDSKSVSPVTCVPNESWWSSEKTTCN